MPEHIPTPDEIKARSIDACIHRIQAAQETGHRAAIHNPTETPITPTLTGISLSYNQICLSWSGGWQHVIAIDPPATMGNTADALIRAAHIIRPSTRSTQPPDAPPGYHQAT